MLYQLIFSPTGGTAKAARLLAEGMDCPCTVIDLTRAGAPETLHLTAEDICIAAVPSFAGRVPAPAAERIGALQGNGARAVVLCVYGNREYEDTLAELQGVLEDAGFCIAAAAAAIAEHSVIRDIAAGRPDENDAAQLRRFGAEIAVRLARGDAAAPVIPGSRPTEPAKPGTLLPYGQEACTECGLCAAACPVGAISPVAPRQPREGVCISCMACVAACPSKARGLAPEAVKKVSAMLHQACTERKENQLL